MNIWKGADQSAPQHDEHNCHWSQPLLSLREKKSVYISLSLSLWLSLVTSYSFPKWEKNQSTSPPFSLSLSLSLILSFFLSLSLYVCDGRIWNKYALRGGVCVQQKYMLVLDERTCFSSDDPGKKSNKITRSIAALCNTGVKPRLFYHVGGFNYGCLPIAWHRPSSIIIVIIFIMIDIIPKN